MSEVKRDGNPDGLDSWLPAGVAKITAVDRHEGVVTHRGMDLENPSDMQFFRVDRNVLWQWPTREPATWRVRLRAALSGAWDGWRNGWRWP